LFGDGSQTRSFCYVDDLVTGLNAMMGSPVEVNETIYMGNPSEFSIRELAEKVVKATDSKSSIEFRPLPTDDPKQRQPDISLARSKLGWSPQIPLEEGLGRTIAYFRDLLGQI
jgi:UDP-glucuronate decarboxylase